MELFLQIVLLGAVFYAFAYAVRWAFHIDRKTPVQRKDKPLRKAERERINKAFDELAKDLRKRPDD